MPFWLTESAFSALKTHLTPATPELSSAQRSEWLARVLGARTYAALKTQFSIQGFPCTINIASGQAWLQRHHLPTNTVDTASIGMFLNCRAAERNTPTSETQIRNIIADDPNLTIFGYKKTSDLQKTSNSAYAEVLASLDTIRFWLRTQLPMQPNLYKTPVSGLCHRIAADLVHWNNVPLDPGLIIMAAQIEGLGLYRYGDTVFLSKTARSWPKIKSPRNSDGQPLRWTPQKTPPTIHRRIQNITRQRKNLMVTSATGHGKTTFLRHCMQYLPDSGTNTIVLDDCGEFLDLPGNVQVLSTQSINWEQRLENFLLPRLSCALVILGETCYKNAHIVTTLASRGVPVWTTLHATDVHDMWNTLYAFTSMEQQHCLSQSTGLVVEVALHRHQFSIKALALYA